MWLGENDSALNLKFMLLNAENLFLLFDKKPDASVLNQADEAQWQKLSSSVYENKSLKKSPMHQGAILPPKSDS